MFILLWLFIGITFYKWHSFALDCANASPDMDAILKIVSEIENYKKKYGKFPDDLSFASGESKADISWFNIIYDKNNLSLVSSTAMHYEYSPLYIYTFGLFGKRNFTCNPGFDLKGL